LGAAICLRAEPLRLPVTARMEASTTWAENISRSSAPANWRDSTRADTSVTVSLLTPLITGVSLITEADARTEFIPRYARNNAFSGGAHLELRWKFGLGAFAPVLSTQVGLSHREAHMAGDTGTLASGALRLAKRFTNAWRASLTGDWSQHYAAHSPFDVRAHRVLGSLTYDLNDTWQLTYGRGSLFGDFTAHASAAIWARALTGQLGPEVAKYYNTVSYETTDSYGPGWVTYRVTGRSDFWWLELSPALGRNTSLPLRYESTYTVNRAGLTYRQDLWTLGLLHRF
jgi:hypothetical protein